MRLKATGGQRQHENRTKMGINSHATARAVGPMHPYVDCTCNQLPTHPRAENPFPATCELWVSCPRQRDHLVVSGLLRHGRSSGWNTPVLLPLEAEAGSATPNTSTAIEVPTDHPSFLRTSPSQDPPATFEISIHFQPQYQIMDIDAAGLMGSKSWSEQNVLNMGERQGSLSPSVDSVLWSADQEEPPVFWLLRYSSSRRARQTCCLPGIRGLMTPSRCSCAMDQPCSSNHVPPYHYFD